MEWIYLESDDAFNLRNISHIWVQKCHSGFFLMGEMIHNQEEVCLTHIFDSYDECIDIIRQICRYNQPERSKREDVYKECEELGHMNTWMPKDQTLCMRCGALNTIEK